MSAQSERSLRTSSFSKPARSNPFSCPVFYAGWLLVLAMLCLLRGWSPGYEAQWYFHKTDLISLASILADDSYPKETIFFQFANTLDTFSLGLRIYRVLIGLGVGPGTLYLVTTYLQIFALALGSSLIAYSFRPALSHLVLSSGVAFLGVFFLFGRYLNLDGIFWLSFSSGHAVGVGLIIIGLLLNRFDRSAAVLAAILSLYHPSHGLVAIALVTVVQVWRLGGGAAQFRKIVSVALIGGALWMPIYAFYFLMVPPFDVSVEQWWTMAVAIQRVMTPLADGMPVVSGLLAGGLLTIGLLSCREFDCIRDTAGRARVVAALVLLLLLVQCFAGEFAQFARLAELCLTRSQPYMAIISAVAVVAIARLWWQSSNAGENDRLADRCAAILVIVVALAPPLRLPILWPPPFHIDTIYPLMVLDQWRCVLVLAAALYWSRRRGDQVNPIVLNSTYGLFLTGYTLLLGLRTEVLCATALLGIFYLPSVRALVPTIPWPPKSAIPGALGVAFVIVAALSLQKRPGWSNATLKYGMGDSVIQQHVPKGAMILVVPHSASGVIQLLPYYSEFLDGYEMRFTLYAPWLTALALDRLHLQGINPLDYRDECSKSPLWLSQCLKIRFSKDATRRDDAWRRNLKRMIQLSPRLTHVLILQRHMCSNDKPEAETGQFALIRVGDVAPAGCT